ncbi:MAG: efflux RND transporter periplasmic adaptor subunit [Prevotellaceae bacterium]|jgi:HlyD family secretion protein|nr:efflux RND transporter periplasmic adaptor subunit [Prevotellaceae bacterium]
MTKRRLIFIIIGVVAVAAVAFLIFHKGGNNTLQINTATVSECSVELSVTATGYVQPVDKVEVGTQVSGVIEKIFVDYNSHVKKGQLLAEIDKSTLNEQLTQAQASLNAAQSDLNYAQQNYSRLKGLFDLKAATQEALESAANQLAQAQSALATQKANLQKAKVNLSYAEIYSPIDGVILDRAVEQGQTVAASFNTPTLFTIANDLKKMQIEANVDEADIGSVRTGQAVTFSVDAYTDDIFNGNVREIRLQPTVSNNVVTYTVIVEAPNPDEKLFPGMTANIAIITSRETGICLPNQAMNFEPAKEVFAHYKMNAPKQMPAAKHQAWVETPNGIEVKTIETGSTDGIKTIVKQGLNAGDKVILSATERQPDTAAEAAGNPLMPSPPKGRR